VLKRKRFRSAIGAFALAWAISGCGREKAAQPREIEVLCGGSFQGPMEKLGRLFEQKTGIRATLVFGQSEDLLPHIKLHSQGDVFVTHDPYAQYTKDADALLRYVIVGHLAPALVVRKGNPQKVERVEDLARSGLRVCLPNPEFSTCGEMVFGLLEKKGIQEAVMKNVDNALFRSHSEVATAIRLGHRDAGIMWNGVAHNWLDAIEMLPTPYEYDKEIRVAVIGLSYSKNRKEVEELLTCAETEGPAVFKEFGYVK